jgi:hypothetical protein
MKKNFISKFKEDNLFSINQELSKLEDKNERAEFLLGIVNDPDVSVYMGFAHIKEFFELYEEFGFKMTRDEKTRAIELFFKLAPNDEIKWLGQKITAFSYRKG